MIAILLCSQWPVRIPESPETPMTVILSLALIGLGVLMRLVPHDPNFVALFSPLALAVFAGARLPRRGSWLVPLVVLVVTDLVLTWNTPYRERLWAPDNFVRYAAVLAAVVIGHRAARLENPLSWVTVGFGASLLFFVTTNFAIWALPAVTLDGQPLYPRTWAGLVDCFALALPFFRNAIVGDLSSTFVLFGIDFAVRRLVVVSAGRSEVAVDAIPARSR